MERDKSAAAQSDRAKRADPPRHARERKGKASAGTWNSSFTKSRHCGGTHWHRDCPKRRKATSDNEAKGRRTQGNVALASADASADDKLDAAIGS
eukprot:539645-Pleurochrysis_carterae.AAC.1